MFSLFLLCVGLGVAVEGTYKMTTHPQTAYCTANFVVKVTVRSEVTTPTTVQAYKQFNIVIDRVFKGQTWVDKLTNKGYLYFTSQYPTTYPEGGKSFTTYPEVGKPYTTYPEGGESYTTYPEVGKSRSTYPESEKAFHTYPEGGNSYTTYPEVGKSYTTYPEVGKSYIMTGDIYEGKFYAAYYNILETITDPSVETMFTRRFQAYDCACWIDTGLYPADWKLSTTTTMCVSPSPCQSYDYCHKENGKCTWKCF